MKLFQKQYDIVAIGDTVTDAFIRLKDAHINCKLDSSECEICMKYGDKIPYEFVEICKAVGNSANAAVSTARLGLRTAIITDLGEDQDGHDAVAEFKKNNIGTDFISLHKGKKTNYHYVLWYEVDRTILIKHETYDRTIPSMKSPKWMYLSSLGEDSLSFHTDIGNYLINNPEVKLAFQPGTFQMKFGTEVLKDIYARTEIFFCNLEESQRILKSESSDIKVLLKGIRDLGPKIAVITDGPKGAYASYGDKAIFMPPYPDPKPPYERTGAGDAFSSTFVAAIAMGKSVEEAITWAPINSMSVVQNIGAQKGLLTQAELKDWLVKAPADYKVKEI
jgi:sugar/nucleoside kinase (ribokinase family)